MADSKNRRAQKKREKQKKKREVAGRARAQRRPVEPPTVGRVRAGVGDAVGWPVGDCYLSSTWHEHGAKVHGGFVRSHTDGRTAAVFFAADLEHGGVTELLVHGNVSADAVQGEMARRSELCGDAMLVAEPDLVAKVFHTALELGEVRPDGLEEALRLFAELDGSGAGHELLTGTPPPPPPKKVTLFSWLFG